MNQSGSPGLSGRGGAGYVHPSASSNARDSGAVTLASTLTLSNYSVYLLSDQHVLFQSGGGLVFYSVESRRPYPLLWGSVTTLDAFCVNKELQLVVCAVRSPRPAILVYSYAPLLKHTQGDEDGEPQKSLSPCRLVKEVPVQGVTPIESVAISRSGIYLLYVTSCVQRTMNLVHMVADQKVISFPVLAGPRYSFLSFNPRNHNEFCAGRGSGLTLYRLVRGLDTTVVTEVKLGITRGSGELVEVVAPERRVYIQRRDNPVSLLVDPLQQDQKDESDEETLQRPQADAVWQFVLDKGPELIASEVQLDTDLVPDPVEQQPTMPAPVEETTFSADSFLAENNNPNGDEQVAVDAAGAVETEPSGDAAGNAALSTPVGAPPLPSGVLDRWQPAMLCRFLQSVGVANVQLHNVQDFLGWGSRAFAEAARSNAAGSGSSRVQISESKTTAGTAAGAGGAHRTSTRDGHRNAPAKSPAVKYRGIVQGGKMYFQPSDAGSGGTSESDNLKFTTDPLGRQISAFAGEDLQDMRLLSHTWTSYGAVLCGTSSGLLLEFRYVIGGYTPEVKSKEKSSHNVVDRRATRRATRRGSLMGGLGTIGARRGSLAVGVRPKVEEKGFRLSTNTFVTGCLFRVFRVAFDSRGQYDEYSPQNGASQTFTRADRRRGRSITSLSLTQFHVMVGTGNGDVLWCPAPKDESNDGSTGVQTQDPVGSRYVTTPSFAPPSFSWLLTDGGGVRSISDTPAELCSGYKALTFLSRQSVVHAPSNVVNPWGSSYENVCDLLQAEEDEGKWNHATLENGAQPTCTKLSLGLPTLTGEGEGSEEQKDPHSQQQLPQPQQEQLQQKQPTLASSFERWTESHGRCVDSMCAGCIGGTPWYHSAVTAAWPGVMNMDYAPGYSSFVALSGDGQLTVIVQPPFVSPTMQLTQFTVMQLAVSLQPQLMGAQADAGLLPRGHHVGPSKLASVYKSGVSGADRVFRSDFQTRNVNRALPFLDLMRTTPPGGLMLLDWLSPVSGDSLENHTVVAAGGGVDSLVSRAHGGAQEADVRNRMVQDWVQLWKDTVDSNGNVTGAAAEAPWNTAKSPSFVDACNRRAVSVQAVYLRSLRAVAFVATNGTLWVSSVVNGGLMAVASVSGHDAPFGAGKGFSEIASLLQKAGGDTEDDALPADSSSLSLVHPAHFSTFCVTAVDASPDGSLLFVGTVAGVVRVFDLSSLGKREQPDDTGSRRKSKPCVRCVFAQRVHDGAVRSVRVHPSGSMFATLGADHRVMFVRLNTHFDLIGYYDVAGSEGHGMVCMDFVHLGGGEESESKKEDESTYKLFLGDKRGNLLILTPPPHTYMSTTTFALKKKLVSPLLSATKTAAVAFESHPTQSNRYFVVSTNKRLDLYQLDLEASDERTEVLSEWIESAPGFHQKMCTSLASSRGLGVGLVASGGADGQIIIRHVLDLKTKVVLQAHSFAAGGVSSLCFSEDGEELVSAGGDGSVYVWDVSRFLASAQQGSHQKAIAAVRRAEESKQLLGMTPTELSGLRLVSPVISGDDPGYIQTCSSVLLQAAGSGESGLKTALDSVRARVQKLIQRNAQAPEREQMPGDEFVIDVKLREILLAEASEKAKQLRERLAVENVGMELVWSRIKAECWDEMESKGRQLISLGDLFAGNDNGNRLHRQLLSKSKDSERFVVHEFPIRKLKSADVRRVRQMEFLRRMQMDEDDWYVENAYDTAGLQQMYAHKEQQRKAHHLLNAGGVAGASDWGEEKGQSYETDLTLDFENISDELLSHLDASPHLLRKRFAQMKWTSDPRWMREFTAISQFIVNNIRDTAKNAGIETGPGALASAGSGFGGAAGGAAANTSSGPGNVPGEFLDTLKLDCTALYHPSELYTRVRRIIQVNLLRWKMRELKKKMNARFAELFANKEENAQVIVAKLAKMQQILSELRNEMKMRSVAMTESEKMEMILEVRDEEITATKVLSAEEQAAIDAARKKKESMRGHIEMVQRALGDMMGGSLEAKKERLLEMEVAIDPPAWLEQFPDESQWTDRQRREYVAYQDQLKEAEAQRDQLRRQMESEVKKLQSDVIDICRAFDHSLRELWEGQMSVSRSIYQQQLVILTLVGDVWRCEQDAEADVLYLSLLRSLHTQQSFWTDAAHLLRMRVEECKQKEVQLQQQLRVLQNQGMFLKDFEAAGEDVYLLWHMLEAVGVPKEQVPDGMQSVTTHTRRSSLDRRGSFDRRGSMDRRGSTDAGSRRGSISRRPSVNAGGHSRRGSLGRRSRRGSLGSVNLAEDPDFSKIGDGKLIDLNPFGPKPPAQVPWKVTGPAVEGKKGASYVPGDVPCLLLPPFEELDSSQQPSAVSAELWEAFLDRRHEKYEVMESLSRESRRLRKFQFKTEEVERMASQGNEVLAHLRELKSAEDFRREVENLNCEYMLSIVQGCVELVEEPVITDLSDAVMIPRRQVVLLNQLVMQRADDIVEVLKEIIKNRRARRKNQWKLSVLKLTLKDAQASTRELQLIRVTKDLQHLIKVGGRDVQASAEIGILEKKIAHLARATFNEIELKRSKLRQIRSQCRHQSMENALLEHTAKNLRALVQKRESVISMRQDSDRSQQSSRKRFVKIARRRRLVDTVESQAKYLRELTMFRDELRMRNFPSFSVPNQPHGGPGRRRVGNSGIPQRRQEAWEVARETRVHNLLRSMNNGPVRSGSRSARGSRQRHSRQRSSPRGFNGGSMSARGSTGRGGGGMGSPNGDGRMDLSLRGESKSSTRWDQQKRVPPSSGARPSAAPSGEAPPSSDSSTHLPPIQGGR